MKLNLSSHTSAAVRQRAEEFEKVNLLTSGATFAMDLWAGTDRYDPDAAYAAFEFCRLAEQDLRRLAREACDKIRAGNREDFEKAVGAARVIIERADLFERVREVFRKAVEKSQEDAIGAAYQKLLDNELRTDHRHARFTLARLRQTTRRNWQTGKEEPYEIRDTLVRGKDYNNKSVLEFARDRRMEVTWANLGTAIKNAKKMVADRYGESEVEVIIDSGKLWSIDSKADDDERMLRNQQSLMGRRVLGTIRRLR